jgi:hypothetical protein
LLTVGNTYEIELAGTAASGAGSTGNIRYGVNYTVTQNTSFKGNAAVETRAVTTYIDSFAGLPTVGTAISVLNYSQIQGAELLNYGSSSQISAAGQTINSITSFAPAVRTFLNWTAGQTLTQTYTSTTESTGLPVAVPPTVTTSTSSTRFLGIENITVPAGTFAACRFENTTNGVVSTSWSAATGRYSGLLLRAQDNATGNAVQATRLRFNGS